MGMVSQAYRDANTVTVEGQKNNTADGDVWMSPRFIKEVERISNFESREDFNGEGVFVGKTPQNLIDLGFPDLPISIGSKHLYLIVNKDGIFKGTDDHYHNLGSDFAGMLPDLISDPTITFVESYGGTESNPYPTICMVTDYTDKDGKPVIIYVKFSQRSNFIDMNITTNNVATMYGKKGSSIISDIKNAYNAGRVLQANEKSHPFHDAERRVPSDFWSQCPEGLWKDDFSDSISLFKRKVNRFIPNSRVRRKANSAYKLYMQKGNLLKSDRAPTYAPKFYSKMGNVVDTVKQDKLGAASIVSMLRGKGVKAEEIKWSGLEQWLQGKKSVTKEELQEFIRGSQLQIEEIILTDKEIPYTAEGMKNSVLYDGQPLFQERYTADGGMANRTLLANALESAAQSDLERQKLTEYKQKIERVSELLRCFSVLQGTPASH